MKISMKKISVILSVLFCSVSAIAQTGTGDDFEAGLTSAWNENTSQYALSLYPSTNPTNKQVIVSCTGAGVSYTGFPYAFTSINVTDAPFVSVKIKSGSAFTLRIDMLDINGRITNQVDTKQNITADNTKYIDYLFDFTGRFYQQYGTNNGPVDATQIVGLVFIVNPGSASAPGYDGAFFMDSVMVGTRAKANITNGAKGIKMNQIGFFKDGYKTAIIAGATSPEFYLVNTTLTDTLYTGTLSAASTWTYSGESVRKADFTDFKTPGQYKMRVPGVPTPSGTFTISQTPLNEVAKGSIKGFYYQRASTALPATYAGAWSRSAGHPDNAVVIHNSAASPGRPTGSTISSRRGWYDAGDYNKYVVNSGISTYQVLSCYEHFASYYDTIHLNIPESNNAIPDVLDEALYNVRWMLTMQDPYDGGVYHKLTNANFDGDVMPNFATTTRYVVQKSTGATLDFSAVMAQSARIFANYTTELPGLSDSCITAAIKAYDWAIQNPSMYYNQNNLSNPTITTGGYGDGNYSDEFNWAAAELFTTTLKPEYYAAFDMSRSADLPGWPNVHTLGLISMAHNRVAIADVVVNTQNGGVTDTTLIKNKIIGLANYYRTEANSTSPYGVAMGQGAWNFGWGSNATAANQSIILIQAFNYTKDSTYLKAALSNVDYLLGRNGLNNCFVTGYGTSSSKRPHHRVSQADGVVLPVPGLLVGGPNPGQQDGCGGYPSSLPALSYLDTECSYASNEIAINWNAPLAYITGAIQSIYSGIEPSSKSYIVEIPTSTRSAILKNINISVYPNPTSSNLYVEKPFELIAAPVIVDLNGNEYKVTGDWSSNTIQLNTAGLSEGLYLIRLQGENGAAIQKFTVIK
jgi:endoglucanase